MGHMQLFPIIQSGFFSYVKTYTYLYTYIYERNAVFSLEHPMCGGRGGGFTPPLNWMFHLKDLMSRGGGGAVSTPPP